MESDPNKPDDLLENVGNLDTARMTLRWALERIRSLERNLSDSQKLLQDAVHARDKALHDAESKKRDFDARNRSLEEKERFVGDMQAMFNDLFRGDVQVADVIRLKRDLDEEKQALEKKVRDRIEEVGAVRQQDIAAHQEQLAEIEATYSGALSEAQKRYHAQLEEIRRSHEADLAQEKRKFEDFRDSVLSEKRLEEEERHQKIILLEKEYAHRRVELQRGFDGAKAKIIEEQKKVWASERSHLEKELADRDARIADLETSLRHLETDFHEKSISQAQEARLRLGDFQRELTAEKESQIQVERDRHKKKTDEYAAEMHQIREELARRRQEFQEDRIRIIQEQQILKEESLKTLREAAEKSSRSAAERIAELETQHKRNIESVRSALEETHKAHRDQDRQQTESDLDALRKFYESMLAGEKAEFEKRLAEVTEGRAQEADQLLRRFEHQAAATSTAHQKAMAALADGHTQDVASLQVRISKLQDELSSQRSAFQVQREADKREFADAREKIISAYEERIKKHTDQLHELEKRLAQKEHLRDADTENYRAKRRELETAFETIAQEKEARTRQQDVQELEAVRLHYQKLFQDRQKAYEAQTNALSGEVELLREKLSARGKTEQEKNLNLLEEHARRIDSLREKYEALLEESRRRHLPGWLQTLKSVLEVLFGPRVLAGILTVSLAAYGIFYWRQVPPGVDYKVPMSHITALTWRANALWGADWMDQSVFRMKLTSKGLIPDGRFPVARSRITGMTFVGDRIYLADSLNKEIQRWKLEKDRIVMEKAWPSPGDSPSALHFDGKNVWSADLLGKRIYQHALDEDLTVLTTFPADQAPIALFAEKDTFWSADSNSRLLFQHRWDDSLTAVAAYHLDELQKGKTSLSAFTIKDGKAWLARDGESVVMTRSIKAFRKVPISFKSAH